MNWNHIPDLVLRKRFTDSQTRLSRAGRQKNVSNAFLLNKKYDMKNKNILLIDDVFTTGATTNECSRVPRDAGARTLRSIGPVADPGRDDPGDIIAQFVGPNQQNIYCSPVGWDPDDEVMFFTKYNNSQISVWRHDNYEDFEQVRTFGTPNPMDGGWYDGLLYICTLNNNQVLRRFDVEGNQVGEIGMGFPVYGVAFDSEEGLMFARNQNAGGAIQVYEMDGNDRGEQIGTINNWQQFNGNNVNVYTVEWVPKHPDGQLWMVNNGTHNIYEIAVDTDEWQATGAVQNFPANITQPWDAITHDGENMWVGGWGANNIRIYDDGVAEMRWISLDPEEGTLEPAADMDVICILNAEGLAAGAYEADIHFLSNDPEDPDQVVTVNMNVVGAAFVNEDPEATIPLPDELDGDPVVFPPAYVGYDPPDGESRLDIIIANSGSEALAFEDIVVEPEDEFSFEFEGENIPPFEEAPVTLIFTPAELGDRAGTITFHSNAENEAFEEGVFHYELQGIGQDPPVIWIDPDADFGVSMNVDDDPLEVLGPQHRADAGSSDGAVVRLSAGHHTGDGN